MYREAQSGPTAGAPGGRPADTPGASGPKEGEVEDAEFEDLGEKK
jgi:hypothetical protein